MTKRKSKRTAEFKPPKRAQPSTKRQKSTEETNQSDDENQSLTPESCSDKLDELQPGQSTLQVTPTTEFPVDPCCSLEEKTSHAINAEDGNATDPPEVPHEIEQNVANIVQTPELDNSDKYTLNMEVSNIDQPNVELDDEQSEITNNSNYESHETSDDQIGIQMPEEAGSPDPLVKRRVRKRMGMCWLGERKNMLKGQPTGSNEFGGGQENEAGQFTNEEPVMMSDSGEKDLFVCLEEEGGTECEVSPPFIPTSCPMEDVPVQVEQEQPDMQYEKKFQILVECMSITHESDNTIPSHANADDLHPPEQNEIKCMEQNESNIRKTNEASASEVANHFEEELTVQSNETEQCCPCECGLNTSIVDHTIEQSVQGMDITADETIGSLPVVYKTEDNYESLDITLVSTKVTAENTADCGDNSVLSLSLPAAPPGAENEDVHSFTEHENLPSDSYEPHLSPVAEPDPSSPLSVDSVTDSQLNNIAQSLEELPIPEASSDLEDATELVSSLIRDIACLNKLVIDARRKIGFGQQGRQPPRPQLHTQKYRHNTNRF
ncbi:TATA-box-binding protein [Labeo rohita]|uniref:TATA-box-binding protein n=1 Tax=Labeo rohita TaxID=84645 RepID=A0ABQ8MZ13_LABRO|nr:uncharacterized protein si:ch211-286b5.2 isoform X1 [Labeo rohita]KAI2668079.1 TATA-box-binding protein [Labeo rohita]